MGLHYASCAFCFSDFVALRNLLDALKLSVEWISRSTDPEGSLGCEAFKAYRLNVLVEKLENLTDRQVPDFFSSMRLYESQ
jgi:hypothetical protein